MPCSRHTNIPNATASTLSKRARSVKKQCKISAFLRAFEVQPKRLAFGMVNAGVSLPDERSAGCGCSHPVLVADRDWKGWASPPGEA